MMTADQILDAANRAYHEDRMDDWRAWHSLLQVMGLMPDGTGGLVAITQLVQQARERIEARCQKRTDNDDLQFDYEREAEAQNINLRELMR